MQKKWVTYVVIVIIIVLVETVAIWMGTEEIFNIIHFEGRQVWIFHPAARIFLWSLTTVCEIIAIARTYYWPASNIRSYMLLLFTLYFGIDLLMPLTLSMFPQLPIAPFIFGALSCLAAALIIISFRKDKITSFLLLPSLFFMVLRTCFKVGLAL